MKISHHLSKSFVIVALFLAATGSCFAQRCNIAVEAATQSGNGIVEVPKNGSAAFALSTTNEGQTCNISVAAIGFAGESSPSDLKVTICQTNQEAACINPTTPTSPISVSPFAAGAQPTFSVFLQTTGALPSGTEICVVFVDQSGNGDGSICVPAQTT